MNGTTLDAFDYVPAMLEHVWHQLGSSAPELTMLRALYRRRMVASAPDFVGTMRTT